MFRVRVALALPVILTVLIAAGFAGTASDSSGSGAVSGSSVGTAAAAPWPAPTVSSFTVFPTLVAPGEFVNFSWASANATEFVVTPTMVQEDMILPPLATNYAYNTIGLAQTTTFTATARSGASASAPTAATLTVIPVILSASATNIHAGQSVALRYSGPNNNSTSWGLNISGRDTPVPLTPSCSGNVCSGSFNPGPLAATTTFSVSMMGPEPTGGQAYSPIVVVNVKDPTTLTFKAGAQDLKSAGDVVLSWTTTNASAVTIDHGIGELKSVGAGSYCCVHPTETTTYTATAIPIYPGAPPLVQTASVTVSTGNISNLKHIIYILQENRTFDNYFGNLAEYRVNHVPPIPGAQLSDVNDLHTLPPDFKLCNSDQQCFPPFHAHSVCVDNLSPGWYETHANMDLVGGDWLHLGLDSKFLMDLFLWQAAKRDEDPMQTRPLGYYDQTDLPFYYELATQFAVGDSWFSALASNTLPNRMYMFSGTSYGHAAAPGSQNDPAWYRPTIFRLLTARGISWRYYFQDNSVFLAQWKDWNDPLIRHNVRNIQELWDNLKSPNADALLPEVIFIEHASQFRLDEHPINNVQMGSARVARMVGQLTQSAAWHDSAFIITYDEGGGLFDHVPPILVTPPDDVTPTDLTSHDQPGLFNVSGLRVPVIVVSPWVKPQTVIHMKTDFTSILKLIEDRFNLPPLTRRDATTQDMADPQNGFFDFSFPHLLKPPQLPTQPTDGVCDYGLSGY